MTKWSYENYSHIVITSCSKAEPQPNTGRFGIHVVSDYVYTLHRSERIRNCSKICTVPPVTSTNSKISATFVRYSSPSQHEVVTHS